MAKNTPRDRVWSTALKLAHEQKDNAWRSFREIGAVDVEERLEDAPSRRTIRDVLASMAEEGVLEATNKNGAYQWRNPEDWADAEVDA